MKCNYPYCEGETSKQENNMRDVLMSSIKWHFNGETITDIYINKNKTLSHHHHYYRPIQVVKIQLTYFFLLGRKIQIKECILSFLFSHKNRWNVTSNSLRLLLCALKCFFVVVLFKRRESHNLHVWEFSLEKISTLKHFSWCQIIFFQFQRMF